MMDGTKFPFLRRNLKHLLPVIFGLIALLSFMNMGQLLTPRFRFSVDDEMKGPEFWGKIKEAIADPQHPAVPAQLPGPFDTWAGSESKTIRVTPPFRKGGTLILKLLESHDSHPPQIRVESGGKELFRFWVTAGNGVSDQLWRSRGFPSEYSVPIPKDVGGQPISLTSEQGSWIALESITFLPSSPMWKVWRNIPPKRARTLFWIFFPAALISSIVAASSLRGAVEWKLVLINGFMLALIALAGIFLLVFTAAYVEIKTPMLVGDRGRLFMYKRYYVRDPELGWKLVPNFRSYFKETLRGNPHPYLMTNAEGFRSSEEETTIPAKGEAMLLGDSFAQGAYLTQNETIARRLSEKLGGYVFNFGVAGYSTDQEYTVLQKMADRVKAKYVVLLFFNNDFPYMNRVARERGLKKPTYEIQNGKVNFSALRRFPETDENGRIPPLEDETLCCIELGKNASLPRRISLRAGGYFCKALDPFALFEALKADIAKTKIRYNLRSYELRFEKYDRPDALEHEWDTAFQFIVRMKEISESHGMKFIVFMIPELAQIMNASGHEKFYLQKRFVELCDANRIQCIEPSQAYLDAQRWQDLFFMEDRHFNPFGAQLAADLIYRRIEELK